MMKKYQIEDIEIFADGLDHPESVAVKADGTIWAGGEAGQIYRIMPDGQYAEVANTGGFNLGLAFSPAGWLAICDLRAKKIWKLDTETMELCEWAVAAGGKAFQTPNFLVFDRKGGCFLSDSGTFRQHNGRIIYLDSKGQGTIWHEGPFRFANGLALSADGNTLYVVSTWLPGVEAIDIDVAGRAVNRRVLVELPQSCPDGIALDQEGNMYISCYAPNCIYRLTANGKLTELISDWESHTLCNPTNIAFGGKDMQDLFIANLGRWHIGKLRLDVPGQKLNHL